jgi:hypothetical protein
MVLFRRINNVKNTANIKASLHNKLSTPLIKLGTNNAIIIAGMKVNKYPKKYSRVNDFALFSVSLPHFLFKIIIVANIGK